MVVSTSKSGVQCTLVGDGMVGKTCLARSFVDRTFPHSYVATVMDKYSGTTYVDGDKYGITLTDMAGEHDAVTLTTTKSLDTDVFIICYSVVDRESYDSVREFWAPQLRTRKLPIILISTQTDLRKDTCSQHVSRKEGESLAKMISAKSFIETSALAKEAVPAVFKSVVQVSLRHHKKKSNIIKRVFNI